MTLCTVAGCRKKRCGHGYCKNHYYRFKKYGDPNGQPPPRAQRPRQHCGVPDCGAPYHCRGYCRSHYNRLYRVGQVEPLPTQIERIEELAWCGWTLPDVAKRLNCTESAVERACFRAGRADLLQSIQRRTEYDIAS